MRTTLACSAVLIIGMACAIKSAAQGFSPEDAVKRMKVPDGFRVVLAACEPDIRQPISISFDDRGRMWVLQYLQYPNPEGLKAVKVDQYLRTVYDKIPEPPPRGPKGADRITILEDDGHGRFRKKKDFVTGLNLASGMCLGHGGVFVVQPPYLLFYADRNGDDVPDGDPEVLLTGFGMEDSHAYANSLQWGPDGWLYGAQGSTVTAKIRGLTFQQGIWRYHPLTKEFELFAEGGGNTWGLDFDRHGQILAGTNFGHAVMLHQVQGGYYVKNFAKHGELQNPHAYGFFEHVPHQGFKGGHVTCGGIVYRGGSFPASFNDTYIACNLLANAVYWHVIEPNGSSFTSRHGGDLLLANDTWFRPIDCQIGPDGSVYVADWYDKRANHVDPIDNWDKSNGRVYKIEAVGTESVRGLCLSRLSSLELVGLLNHKNIWFVREARRILSERSDPAIVPVLRQIVKRDTGQLALEALWALHVCRGVDEEFALTSLSHPNEHVRAWIVRLLGDANQLSPAALETIENVAKGPIAPTLACQIASTCRRLPASQSLRLIRPLARHGLAEGDPHFPLLSWWAIERLATSERESILELVTGDEDSRAFAKRHGVVPSANPFLLRRLARRYMSEAHTDGWSMCARLVGRLSSAEDIDLVIDGMDEAMTGRQLTEVPAVLAPLLENLQRTHGHKIKLLRLAVRCGDVASFERAASFVSDVNQRAEDRATLIGVIGEAKRKESVPILVHLLDKQHTLAIREAALSALSTWIDSEVTNTILSEYLAMPASLQSRARAVLFSRPTSALGFLKAVDAGRIDAKTAPIHQLRGLAQHNNQELNELVEKHWGKFTAASAGEKLARIANLRGRVLAQRSGDAVTGKVVYDKKCALCHALFGEGGKVGPDLTGADRRNRDHMLLSVVDPSAAVRREHMAYTVATTNGRLLTGVVAESTPQTVTLLDAQAERVVLSKSEIEMMNPSPNSLMPEGLLDDLGDVQIQDLFAYLESNPLPRDDLRSKDQTAPPPLKVCLVSGSLEYKSDESLAAFQGYLEKNFNVQCTRAFRKADDDLPGLEALETCDVMLLYTRRLTIEGPQLERVKKYCRSGKPIVAVRTASHAFQKWLELDKEILGGDYQGHYGAGPTCDVRINASAKEHPILSGVKPFSSPGSLYKNPNPAKDITVLLTGHIKDHSEPVAWTRTHKGGRVFYTSLGHADDFGNENFRRMLSNALFWTSQRSPDKR